MEPPFKLPLRKIKLSETGALYCLVDLADRIVCGYLHDADADALIAAVNAHADLVARVEELDGALRVCEKLSGNVDTDSVLSTQAKLRWWVILNRHRP